MLSAAAIRTDRDRRRPRPAPAAHDHEGIEVVRGIVIACALSIPAWIGLGLALRSLAG